MIFKLHKNLDYRKRSEFIVEAVREKILKPNGLDSVR